jgi:HemY protein
VKLLLRLAIALLLAIPVAAAGYYLAQDPGQLIVGWFNTEIETTLVVAALLLALLLMLLAGLLWLWRMPRQLVRRRVRALRQKLRTGLEASLAGRHQLAHDEFLRAAALADQRDVALLLASRAAAAAGLKDTDSLRAKIDAGSAMRRLADLDALAERARQGDAASVNALLTQAAQEGDPQSLRLAVEVARERGRSADALALLPKLKAVGGADARWLEQASAELHTQALQQASTAAALDALWQSLGAQDRQQGVLVEAYVDAAVRHGQIAEAAAALDYALERGPCERLYRWLPQVLQADQGEARLRQVDRLLVAHGESAMLRYARGALLAGMKRGELARVDLLRSIELSPSVEAWVALGDLESGLGQLGAAQKAYAGAVRHFRA